MAQLLYPPSVNNLSKELGGAYTSGSATITLNNVTDLQNKPGACIINRVNTSGERQLSSAWTYIEFTGVSGSTLTGCSAISGDQNHGVGEVVEFVSDVTQQQRVLNALANLVVPSTGALDTTKVVDLTTVQTLTNKTLTTPIITAPTWDGWLSNGLTWTYASASTFTVAGDYTTTFTKGTKLKFTQTTTKYAVVVSSSYGAPNTTVTIAVNTDYVIANAAITSPFYSYVENPQGYPSFYNWSPTQTGFSSAPANGIYEYSIIGNNKCLLFITQPANGTSNATGFSLTLPITAKTLTNMLWTGTAQATDNGSLLANPSLLYVQSAGTTVIAAKDYSGAAWTNANGKKLNAGNIIYEI